MFLEPLWWAALDLLSLLILWAALASIHLGPNSHLENKTILVKYRREPQEDSCPGFGSEDRSPSGGCYPFKKSILKRIEARLTLFVEPAMIFMCGGDEPRAESGRTTSTGGSRAGSQLRNRPRWPVCFNIKSICGRWKIFITCLVKMHMRSTWQKEVA